jgi:hypothetical protein
LPKDGSVEKPKCRIAFSGLSGDLAMTIKMLPIGAFALIVLMASSGTGIARILANWPYDKLMKEADLVVIAVPSKTEDADDKPPEHVWNYEFVGQNTTFEIKSALKGKVDGKSIKVLHFRFGDLKKGLDPNDFFSHVIMDGPCFVAFDLAKPASEHLLYLKLMKDGRYEPVSGRVDPELSVRQLTKPLSESNEKKPK